MKSMNSDTPLTDAALDSLAEDQRGQVHYNGITFIEHAKQLEIKLAAIESAIKQAIKEIESDALSCERESDKFKQANDQINAYLMGTQAMAHRLDINRINRALA